MRCAIFSDKLDDKEIINAGKLVIVKDMRDTDQQFCVPRGKRQI